MRPLMASSKKVLLLAVVAAVACLASLASATVFMVGDDLGWRSKFNETGWADGKTFVVGDSLLFMYNKENHTVAQVSEDDFAACNTQGKLLAIWNSGNAVVHLDQPGKAWFICTKPNHCLNGMKLAVDVVDGGGTSPSAPAAPLPSTFPFPGVPAPAPSPSFGPPFPWPFPGVPAVPVTPSPPFHFPIPWWGASDPPPPWLAAPPSAAVRNPVGRAVNAAAAVVVTAALAF